MLMRFDPFRDGDRLAEQTLAALRLRNGPMALDAYRRGDEVKVQVDLPGVDPATIDLVVEKNVLSVKAERQWKTEGVETVVCERPVGTFTRELLLGENLDTDRIAASYEDGVLRLAIPVVEQAKARRIEVSTSVKKEKEAITTASAG
jgi:HSP20 family protein